ncbi:MULTISPECIES: cysteine hydrolase family protein [unclassified Enterococcus]|uniref:cysteine hydrolase family protein n=1 Tax=unclassified Enterococcus TaxID=2608891 RepID=UPI0015521E41|nr:MULTISPECIES: cysteine hydrolase family protein [unclassified Enterococcus]MBS7577614.1 cysteine hydrolase [Enterococcus sp. MMGLQ5-2]MBS7584887.1 cysteine hydrolase [Enterococcus sp. MMGLQ5-1]NPD12742.1 cysteine hydrolase [Enterococcus sp. MMGLQ5-1]NPD37447.1 cysteine hydrolase [Enterococcus sp. MMGLQ5-2]
MKKKRALLVIDVQNDYFKNGRLPLEHPETVLRKINQLEKKFIRMNQPIIYIQHISRHKIAPFFMAGTSGVKLHQGLIINPESTIVTKQFPNSFYKTNLKQLLDKLEIEQLVITGMMTHMCIDSTTRASFELGYQPIVILDAVTTRELAFDSQIVSAKEVQTAFLASFETFAKVVSTKEFLAE